MVLVTYNVRYVHCTHFTFLKSDHLDRTISLRYGLSSQCLLWGFSYYGIKIMIPVLDESRHDNFIYDVNDWGRYGAWLTETPQVSGHTFIYTSVYGLRNPSVSRFMFLPGFFFCQSSSIAVKILVLDFRGNLRLYIRLHLTF